MSNNKTVLVLGATGGAGRETALALSKRGWRIRALHRTGADAATALPQAEWVKGDAMSREDLIRAARGCELIVHGVNPPAYRNWRQLALPMLENTIAAAEAIGARIFFPGTIYNYGPDAFPVLRETSPQHPVTRKGAIRVEMERMLEAAAGRGVRTVILRAGDFFGPHAGSSWFSQGMVKPGAPLASVTHPGRRGVGHAWAYLPDFAEAGARLVEADKRLPAFDTFHFGGHWFEDGRELAERARTVAGKPRAPIRDFPWTAMLALSPFVRLFREMAEMRYLWRRSLRLDNAKLTCVIGAEPHTEIDEALGATLAAMGCLPTQSGRAERVNAGFA